MMLDLLEYPYSYRIFESFSYSLKSRFEGRRLDTVLLKLAAILESAVRTSKGFGHELTACFMMVCANLVTYGNNTPSKTD